MDPKFRPMLEDFSEEIARCIEKYSSKVAPPEFEELPGSVTSLVPQLAN
jgi:hypothetical protein